MERKKLTRSDILFIRQLADRQVRRQHRLFAVEGEKNVAEMCRSALRVQSIYAEAAWYDLRIVEEMPYEPDTYIVNNQELGRISRQKTPDRVMALVHMPEHRFHMENLAGKLSLMLDRVQDPGNMGTILRIADWFGIDHILCSEDTVDAFSSKVVQASMGAVARVSVHYGDLVRWAEEAAACGIPLYGTFLDGENIYKQELTAGGIVVMGNESQGISPALAGHIGRRLWLPCHPAGTPRSESLNVAVATALVCGEFRRRISL